MLPFTPEQFLAVFVNYNSAIWPIQIAAYLFGGIAVALLFRKTRDADRVIAGILAVMWLWTGFGYHGLWFSVINKAAYRFDALFVVQGYYRIYAGVYRHQMRFGLRPGFATWVGTAFVAYGAIAYPLIGEATGHHYPEMPMFGVTPYPVTIFAFGLLLLTMKPVPRWLLVIPFVWDRRQLRHSPPRAPRLASPCQQLHRRAADGFSRAAGYTGCPPAGGV